MSSKHFQKQEFIIRQSNQSLGCNSLPNFSGRTVGGRVENGACISLLQLVETVFYLKSDPKQ